MWVILKLFERNSVRFSWAKSRKEYGIVKKIYHKKKMNSRNLTQFKLQGQSQKFLCFPFPIWISESMREGICFDNFFGQCFLS